MRVIVVSPLMPRRVGSAGRTVRQLRGQGVGTRTSAPLAAMRRACKEADGKRGSGSAASAAEG